MLHFPIRFMSFQCAFILILLLEAISYQSLLALETGTQVATSSRVKTVTSRQSQLACPTDGTKGDSLVPNTELPDPQRYKTTPNPESVASTPMVRPDQGGTGGRILLVSDVLTTPRYSQPAYFQEETATPARTEKKPGLPRPAPDKNDSQATEVDPYHPPVRTAAFLNIVPGVSVREEVLEHWGEPIKKTNQNGQDVHLYSTEILNHIEVIYRDDVVRSIIVRLDEPFPEEQVRTVLQSELLKSKPVLIPDESGKIIGEIFPEKGVLFLFTLSENGHVFMVKQIGIEPVTSEPFVLRAEATMNNQPFFWARRDLEDAIKVNPQDAKAYGLLAKINLMEGRVDTALVNCEKAIQLDQRRPAYHLTMAETLSRMNRVEQAKQYLEETLEICHRFPHERARALCMLGDLYRTGPVPDYETAIDYHSDAIRLASTLIEHANPTIRRNAKDILFDAHLGAARDVAWGRWDEKEESIRKWIAQAVELSEDPEMISAKLFSMEYPFKIAVCSLACQVGMSENADIEPDIRRVIDAGELLIQSTDDPILIRRYQWETSLSLYDAVQIYQIRKQYPLSLKYGEITADYMERGVQYRRNDLDYYLLGRLYFRLGAIHAIGNKNHRAAIDWFDRAKPVFEQLLPKINPEELGRLGETLVSMGVSYWMTDQREEGIRLTERGLKLIDRGVKLGILEQSAYAIPYSNLENMYRELGQVERVRRYAQLSEMIK